MEKIIQVLFNNEVEAFTGLQALQQLDLTKDISLGETYVLSKDENGKTAIKSAKDKSQGSGIIGGGLLGGLLGILAGPLGFIVGLAGGMIAGSAGETLHAEDVSDYLDAVSANVPNGKSVLVAHVWEDWETPVNTVLLPISRELKRFKVQDEVFIPAQTELGKINSAVQQAEYKLNQAKDNELSEWKATLTDLKKQQKDLQGKLDKNLALQETQYQQWIEKTKNTDSEQTHEQQSRLKERAGAQKSRLEQIKKNR
ncbi:hypothetical protein [Pedobacter nutrimenti]|jgi:uncharacterized membrane protein|uniref:DUF1269 domain-containing protein n=1 Tax=Pedobacter nutrimenti TaxID=1241337 RepID=A0A318UNE0_9SPHI|nr:hypothetical protein [Pedobacter nutrimenti]PYF71521.1 hypothetical protein B0O44_107136 [Pedobacter nutrimenti]